MRRWQLFFLGIVPAQSNRMMIAERKSDGAVGQEGPSPHRQRRCRDVDSMEVDGEQDDWDRGDFSGNCLRISRSTDEKEAPEEIICQLSKRVVRDPVRTPYGHVSPADDHPGLLMTYPRLNQVLPSFLFNICIISLVPVKTKVRQFSPKSHDAMGDMAFPDKEVQRSPHFYISSFKEMPIVCSTSSSRYIRPRCSLGLSPRNSFGEAGWVRVLDS